MRGSYESNLLFCKTFPALFIQVTPLCLALVRPWDVSEGQLALPFAYRDLGDSLGEGRNLPLVWIGVEGKGLSRKLWNE